MCRIIDESAEQNIIVESGEQNIALCFAKAQNQV
jgi:hypothetical protein